MTKMPCVWTGKGGAIWFNGLLLAYIKSFEAKVTGEFDDLASCGFNGTMSIYKGFSGEGTMVLHKVNSDVLKLIAPAYKSGIMPDIKIVSKHEDNSANNAERIAFEGVVITEIMLAKFEAKAATEESIPFKFADYDILAA